MMDLPYSVEELIEATKDDRARRPACRRCYIRPIAYYGYGEMGLNTLPCSVDVAIACWPWGAYLGDDAVTKGVRMKISLVDRATTTTPCRRRRRPPATTSTRSLAKVEALKAGYDEAIMLNPHGLVSRVHRREHLRAPATASSSPRRSSPARSRASPRTR